MNCILCKRKVSPLALTKAVSYWGGTLYKLLKNKSLTKKEEQRMLKDNNRLMANRVCFLCRQTKSIAHANPVIQLS
jgi:hypothetical protein